MQKDSIIWVSLTGLLGIEGYRMIVNKDSVKLMNKLKKPCNTEASVIYKR